MNNVRLAGNLGKDPEIRVFDKGGKLATFSLATKEEFVNRAGEHTSSTTWHLVSAWGKIADRIEGAAKKGSYVSVEGRLATRSYTDKDGQKRFITEVVATSVSLDTAA